jgi:hypothetical protein
MAAAAYCSSFLSNDDEHLRRWPDAGKGRWRREDLLFRWRGRCRCDHLGDLHGLSEANPLGLLLLPRELERALKLTPLRHRGSPSSSTLSLSLGGATGSSRLPSTHRSCRMVGTHGSAGWLSSGADAWPRSREGRTRVGARSVRAHRKLNPNLGSVCARVGQELRSLSTCASLLGAEFESGGHIRTPSLYTVHRWRWPNQ